MEIVIIVTRPFYGGRWSRRHSVIDCLIVDASKRTFSVAFACLQSRLWWAFPVRSKQLLKYFSGLRSDVSTSCLLRSAVDTTIPKVSSFPSAKVQIRDFDQSPKQVNAHRTFSENRTGGNLICSTNSSIKKTSKLIRPSSLTEARNSTRLQSH